MNARTVTGFVEGFTNTGRFPYVLASLSCGHVTQVEIRPNVGQCLNCQQQTALNRTGSTSCPVCMWESFMILKPYPNPHNEADRLTKLGDTLECATCTTEDQQLAWLEALDVYTVHHSRIDRHTGESYHFYRHDPASPSGFFHIGSVMVSPRIEAALRAKRLSPLSPTERA